GRPPRAAPAGGPPAPGPAPAPRRRTRRDAAPRGRARGPRRAGVAPAATARGPAPGPARSPTLAGATGSDRPGHPFPCGRTHPDRGPAAPAANAVLPARAQPAAPPPP